MPETDTWGHRGDKTLALVVGEVELVVVVDTRVAIGGHPGIS